jgi:hypothetical protein
MADSDSHMPDATDSSLASDHSMDNLKCILELRLQEINNSVSTGFSEIKAELNNKVQTIMVAIPKPPTQRSNPVSIGARQSPLQVKTAY